MPKYRLLMRGENFLLNRDGQLEEMGFFTTLWVEAESIEDAELKGVQVLREREDLKEVARNERDNPPMLFLEDGWLLDDDEPLQEKGGYTWWPAEEPAKTPWWQFWK